MGDPLGLGDELSAAHLAVAVSEETLVHLSRLHLEGERDNLSMMTIRMKRMIVVMMIMMMTIMIGSVAGHNLATSESNLATGRSAPT